MSRTQKIIHELKCDRCGWHDTYQETKEDRSYGDAGWATILVRQIGGPFIVGDANGPAEICPSCVRDIAVFKDIIGAP